MGVYICVKEIHSSSNEIRENPMAIYGTGSASQTTNLRITDLRPPQALLNTIRLPQQTPHILQPQPFRLRIHRPNTHPANRTHERVNRKRPRGRREELHHGQERDADDEIASPVRRRREAGAEGSDGQGEELALLPGDVAEACGVAADIDDHGGEDDEGPGAPSLRGGVVVFVGRGGAVVGGTREEFVGCGADYEAGDHDGYGEE